MIRVTCLVSVLAMGCAHGSAEFTNVTPYSGTIALHGDHGAAMSHAQRLMVDVCGKNNYTVLRETADPQPQVDFQCTDPGLAPAHPDSGGAPPPPAGGGGGPPPPPMP